MGKITDQFSLQFEIDSLLGSINKHLSTYISKSEINIFNQFQSTKPFIASPQLLEIIEKSLHIYKQSEGTFDITVQPLVEEWGFSSDYSISMIPDSALIDSILTHTGSDKLFLDHYDDSSLQDG